MNNYSYLQIADFFFKIPSSVKLMKNYRPFLIASDKEEGLTSSVSIENGNLPSEQQRNGMKMIVDNQNIKIYRETTENGGYYIANRPEGRDETYELYATSTWNRVIFSKNCTDNNCPSEVIDLFIMLTFIYSTAYHETVLLHASCIKLQEDAVAFIGQSGAGKSTHSQLWLKYIPETSLLNDDQPAVRINSEGEIVIYGTPWSGKTHCYKQEKATLKAVVRMVQAPYNQLTPMKRIILLKELLSACSMMKAETTSFEIITQTLLKIAVQLTGFMLENKPEKEAVDLSYANTLGKVR